ncbi:L-histidine N(alpha)-methyltransferase [candidate division CSSED10-310 bacterium]|uniref:L-histidine N(Alpha)-methyltransferase n=1 Tax=candidate division CSSED10-310 bacterium TaxID=2855610 RepID=A0ABV6YV37_UNCC1
MDGTLIIDKPRITVRSFVHESFKDQLSLDVIQGLSADQKSIPSKYFYDYRGSILFNKISALPEYYLTRKELSLLHDIAPEIMNSELVGDLIELGSGANVKIKKLLNTLDAESMKDIRYVPFDVSQKTLIAAAEELLDQYPTLHVYGIVGDFTRQLDKIPQASEKLIIFFGSTIGNFDESFCQRFLTDVAGNMHRKDRFLVGLDLIKPKEILEAAYDDEQGLTSTFNKNILQVINSNLKANFNPHKFDHHVYFNEHAEQIEMHLKANKSSTIIFSELDLHIRINQGETIQTEICRKFSQESARKMFSKAGLTVTDWITDPDDWFALAIVKTKNN